MTELILAAEFPAVSQADWMKRVEAVLNGASFEDRLVSTTTDGIRIEPLYGQIPGPRAARHTQAPWTLYQRADHPNSTTANAQALDDLENGATGLVLVTADAPSARGFGIDPAELADILQGVHLHAIALKVEGSASLALADLIAKNPVDPERLNVSFAAATAAEAVDLSRRGFIGPFMEADGRDWHDHGATDAEELGAVLARAVAMMRGLDPLNDFFLTRAVAITLAAGQDLFITLAKFRAMRLLWRAMLEAAGLPDAPLRLHAETSWRMMARLDPHANILRASAAVFGAGLGGADSICVLPFSAPQGLPNAFARRVARNAQTVLMEESHLWRVADPASGAGYVETLTERLCEKAWTVFQACEAGAWPAPRAPAPSGLPVIGTTSHRLSREHAAEIEVIA